MKAVEQITILADTPLLIPQNGEESDIFRLQEGDVFRPGTNSTGQLRWVMRRKGSADVFLSSTFILSLLERGRATWEEREL